MRRRRQEAQAMTEMAMLAPLIFLLMIFVFDLARAAATWAAISEAVREGSRESVVIGQPGLSTAATDASIFTAVENYGVNLSIQQAPGCVHGHSSGTVTPAPATPNTGYIYILAANPATSTVDSPSGGAGYAETVSAGCNAINSAPLGTYPLQVVIAYKFQPFTPFASQFMPSGITMTASSTMNTEF